MSGEDRPEGATPGALAARWPGIEADLAAVAEWMRGHDVALRLAMEPMAGFAEVAARLLATHADFPRDKARAARIVRLLEAGAPPWPIFVDEEDGFVLEGRHRVVAFHMLGLAEIPVVRVSKVEPRPARGP